MLLVARLDGPTPAIARGLVDKALQAEADGLWGRAYFDLRNITDPGYKLGDDWIRGAAEICRRLGFETVVDENPGTFPAAFPMSQIAFYIGWYDGTVSGPFAQPTVEFMPGAFAYHLHSFSAATLRSASQNWVGPLLAKGATITMGCVAEPYLSGHPRPGGLHRPPDLSGVHLRRSGLCGTTGVVLADHGGGRPALPALREESRPAASGAGGARQQAGGMVLVAAGQSQPGGGQTNGGGGRPAGAA